MREEIIGDCRLILGDCLEVMPTLGKVGHVITDPPFDKEAHAPNRRVLSGGLLKNMPLDFAALDNANTMPRVCEYAKTNCGGWFIAFCQAEQVHFWRDAIEASGMKYKTPMIWVKPDCAPKLNGQGPAIGFESLVSAWCGTGHSKWNSGGKRGVYTHLTNPPDRTHLHMTEKPVRLMKELITDFSNRNETILDPFMGSGTTGVACVKLGRKFIGIELDKKYFDIACRRIEEAYRQPDLFIEPPKKIIQDSMI